jgi:ABC-type branched-subunit amino acid transport system substrate-binding protein
MFTQLRQCSGLIALGFVLSLVAGCAQPGSDPSSESVGKSPIKIGQIVDLSGPSADLGKYEQMGAELFAEHINANGGLLGRQLQIVSRDGKGATADAINQAKDLLYGQNVDFIMTGSNSGYAMAISDLARQSKKLMLSQNANDEYTLQKGHPYAFRIPNIIARTQARSAAEPDGSAPARPPGVGFCTGRAADLPGSDRGGELAGGREIRVGRVVARSSL